MQTPVVFSHPQAASNRRHSEYGANFHREQYQNIRRQSHQINSAAMSSLNQLTQYRQQNTENFQKFRSQSVQLNPSLHHPLSLDRSRPPSTTQQPLYRADPTRNQEKAKTIRCVIQEGKSKINKKCPKCQTRNAFDYKNRINSTLAVQCFSCQYKFYLEVRAKKIDHCPACKAKNQFDVPANGTKVRVQCYQCKHSFVSQCTKPPSLPSESRKQPPQPTNLPPQITDWSVKDVQLWLDTVNMSKYQRQFYDDRIDGPTLLEDVDRKLLDSWGIPRLHVKQLWKSIVSLREQATSTSKPLATPTISGLDDLKAKKQQKLRHIKTLQEEKNRLELMLDADNKQRIKELSKEIKKELKKIKKIDVVVAKKLKPRSPPRSERSDTPNSSFSNMEVDDGVKKRIEEKYAKSLLEKRRASMQLDAELEEKRRRLLEMESKLKARTFPSVTNPPPHREESEEESDVSTLDEDYSESLSNMEKSEDVLPLKKPPGQKNGLLNRNLSVTDAMFSAMVDDSGSKEEDQGNDKGDRSSASWSVAEVGDWVSSIGYDQYVEDFATLAVTGKFLMSPQMNEKFLRNLLLIAEPDCLPLLDHISKLK